MIKIVLEKKQQLTLANTSIFILLILFFSETVLGQDDENLVNTYRIVFYNTENFFDPLDDTTSQYDEFDQGGQRYWTWSKYEDKRNRIYKVITAIGEGEPVAMVAFAEIENRTVLEDLLHKTPLTNHNYQIIHFESEDQRGIDVGLVYLEELFTPLSKKPIKVRVEKDTGFRTRDILYVKGLLGKDSLHVFVNHWPSRYGGLLETKELRKAAATTLKAVTDSICLKQKNPAILILGDFNDNPEDKSMLLLTQPGPCNLTNVTSSPGNALVMGTLKYQGQWDSFDQVLISEGLGNGRSDLLLSGGKAYIYCPDFLLEEDTKYLGVKPRRTYEAFKYHDGFSDHLPIYVDIYRNNPQ